MPAHDRVLDGRARSLCFVALLLLADCRCRTTYNGEVTKQCNELAATEYNKLLMDAGGSSATIDPLTHKNICEACCHKNGLNSVEPGPCVCGELGLDGLLK
jgi:hypothetical protein